VETVADEADPTTNPDSDEEGQGPDSVGDGSTGDGSTDDESADNELTGPVIASLELIADKNVRISWQPSLNAEFYRVLENQDGVSGFAAISADLDPSTLTLDHRVALYLRLNARYIVQACNASLCVDSDELVVSSSLARAIGFIKASNTDGGIDEFGLADGDRFGIAVSLSGDGRTLAVGADSESSAAVGVNGNQENNEAKGAGAVYVFVRSDGTWLQQAYLKASYVDEQDGFGSALSLSELGDTLVVGALREDSGAIGIDGNDNNVVLNAGAAYVFERSGNSWRQRAYLKASNSGPSHFFGTSVNISAQGNTIAVGAAFEESLATGVDGDSDDTSVSGAGAVYLFERSGQTWRQESYLKASNTGQGDEFGTSVSLSADGDTLIVGAYGEDSSAVGIDGDQSNNDAPDSGAVYVYVRRAGNWRQQAYIKASNTDQFDRFGSATSVSASGNTLAVGAFRENYAATGVNGNQRDGFADAAGAVYIYERKNQNWQQQAYVKASNTDAGDNFGLSLSLSGDGNTLAVGAMQESSQSAGINGDQMDNSADNAGAVYVFTRNDSGWRQRAYMKAGNAEAMDQFGVSVDVSDDGNTIAVGALGEGSAATGIGGAQDDNSAAGAGAIYLY